MSRKAFRADDAVESQGRWYASDVTKRQASRVRLRPFRLDDASDVCDIYAMFFEDSAVAFARGTMTVAEVQGRVVGFVLWSPALEPAWFDRRVRRWAELNELHVHPTFQDRGIGSRLVRAALRQARRAGHRTMYVITDDANRRARHVYETAGFREHNRIVRYKVRL